MTPVDRLSAPAAPFHDDSSALLEHVASLLASGEDASAVIPRALESLRALSAEMAGRAHQVEAQRRFIEKIIDSLPVGIHVIDREYRIQAWNRKRETGLQGVSRDEAIGRTIFEVLHRQPGEMLRREFQEVFETGRIGRYEMESVATGEPRHYRVSKIPMRIDDEGISHVITIGEDITDWKQARERVAHAEKLAAVGQLAAGVMHEINNPLATIGACGESMTLRLEESGVAEEVRRDLAEYLKIIDTEVYRCKRIIDDLLHFSRRGSVGKALVEVPLVFEEALLLLKHHSTFKKVRVEQHAGEQLRVWGNHEQLVQVLIALLLNAADATGGRGTVRLRAAAAAAPNETMLEVADDGHGIAARERAKIFEPFYTTKPPGKGTGLGLSICYGIVSEHGGRIEVDSTVGAGSTFRVYLPAGEVA